MTHIFLSWAGELYFHFSFSSWFSRLRKNSLSPLDLWDLKKNSLSLLDFQEFSGKFSFHSRFTRFCPLFLCRHIYKAILYSFICSTFLHCVFPSTSLNELLERIHNRTGCICLTFLHNALPNEPTNCLPGRIHIHTSYICLTCLHHGFSNVSSNRLPERMHNHTGCICLTFLHCAFSNVSSKHLDHSMHNRIGCICLTFLQCVFKWVLKVSAREDAKSHWLHLFDFSPLCFFKCLLKWLAWDEA